MLQTSLLIQPISEQFPALEEQEIRFSIYTLVAKLVQVAGTFNDWHGAANPLDHTGAGKLLTLLRLKSASMSIASWWTAAGLTIQRRPNMRPILTADSIQF